MFEWVNELYKLNSGRGSSSCGCGYRAVPKHIIYWNCK